MKIILALSGQLDSCHLADELLKLGHDVTAFHMDFSQAAGWNDASTESCRTVDAANTRALRPILDWFKAKRKEIPLIEVQVEQTTADHSGTGGSIELGAPFMSQGFDAFVTGRSMDNNTNGTVESYWEKYNAVFNANSGGFGRLWFPLIDWGHGRAHAIASLPADLRAMIVACNHPSVDGDGALVPCGRCFKCKIDDEAAEMLAQGVEVDDISDYFLRKRASGPYRGILTPDPAYVWYHAPQRIK